MKKWMVLIFVLAALDTIAGERGHLFLLGGGKKPASVMERFVSQAGGARALILVVPTASSLPDTGEYYRKLLAEHGGHNVQPLDISERSHADRPAHLDLARKAAAVFFSGGDQRRITAAFLNTELLAIIQNRYRTEGLVVGGTSAGTACMSRLMLTGDGDFDRLTADNVVLTPGLGLLSTGIVDQHFLARSRQNRLISVVLEHPNELGIGIDEATAAWVMPDDRLSVIGEGWIQIYDARQARIRRQAGPEGAVHLGAQQMVMHLLQPGDHFDLKTGRPLPPGDTGR